MDLSVPGPVRARRRLATAAAALCLPGLSLTACGSTVTLPDPAMDPATHDICAKVFAAAPQRLLGKERRQTTGSLTAAWGEPPITLTCGVSVPTSMQQDTRCFEVSGVGWHAEQGTTGWLFTTIGRAAVVQVGVPSKYAPEADALVDLGPAVSAGNPSSQPCL